jgi:hypothetical protein
MPEVMIAGPLCGAMPPSRHQPVTSRFDATCSRYSGHYSPHVHAFPDGSAWLWDDGDEDVRTGGTDVYNARGERVDWPMPAQTRCGSCGRPFVEHESVPPFTCTDPLSPSEVTFTPSVWGDTRPSPDVPLPMRDPDEYVRLMRMLTAMRHPVLPPVEPEPERCAWCGMRGHTLDECEEHAASLSAMLEDAESNDYEEPYEEPYEDEDEGPVNDYEESYGCSCVDCVAAAAYRPDIA